VDPLGGFEMNGKSSPFKQKVSMTKKLFTDAEETIIWMAAFEFAGDTSKYSNFKQKLEKIVLDKIFEASETARLANMNPRH
jgi:hypothetical protein